MNYYVYILANRKHGAIYVGCSSDLIGRTWQHKNEVVDSHTKRYGIKRLVYYEAFDNPYNAVQRERNIKHWKRSWKVQLIESNNPEWNDLYLDLFGEESGPAGDPFHLQ